MLNDTDVEELINLFMLYSSKLKHLGISSDNYFIRDN